MYEEFSFSTSKKHDIIDIDGKVREIVGKSKVKEGICTVFCKHATAAIIINENYDPNICLDLIDALNGLIPKGKWRHDKVDGNADAHIKAAILGPNETVPINNGELQLGRWQSLMFIELDGPRSDRTVAVQVLGK
ncbi:secondary thiamine-phosphate synthase enzyme YjbQ [Candidatus Woesearchaeota archaeon]|nr:secondary thiamine-phosphate synthase enzyme YjbQ [Candidatus Woesearchaeota archaeon]